GDRWSRTRRARLTQQSDPEVGRFTSQDSFLGQIDDPPSLHRYFCANDNPLRYVDPTGHEAGNAGCYWGPSSCSGQAAAGQGPGLLSSWGEGVKSLGSLAWEKASS